MGMLGTAAGMVTDAALGLPVRATPYTVARDVAVPMPDEVTLLGDHYRPAGIDVELSPTATAGRVAASRCSTTRRTRPGWSCPSWPGGGRTPSSTALPDAGSERSRSTWWSGTRSGGVRPTA